MIHLQSIALSFGGQPLYQNLNWFIPSGIRIGLIGANGTGKTTLLKLITQELLPDEGRITRATHLKIGYLKQESQELNLGQTVLEEAMTAFQSVLAMEAEVLAITDNLLNLDPKSAAYFSAMKRLDVLNEHLRVAEAHRLHAEAANVLAGLGFTNDDLYKALSQFSGGWRMRVALAKMLLQKPDILLLDEPTNHLDIESIAWLEQYLRAFQGTVIVVSHDRYFLDRMCTHIAELAFGSIQEYAGNYGYYLSEREKRLALRQAAYENQQQQLKETEQFIERFRYKASKAKQVQSRIKGLERIEKIEAPVSDSEQINFRFPEPSPSGRVVLTLSEFSKSYDENLVFEHVPELKIEQGQKIALIGKNGAGKSTLARILLGTEPFEGSRELGYKVELTYFAQHQAEHLDPNLSIFETLRQHQSKANDTQIRSILGAFLFEGDDVFKPISVLSGGERSRVALAKTLLKPANFLILDEPTNHLDIRSVEVLTQALKQFTGTFVVISHDRHFLENTANCVWYAAHQSVEIYPGTYAEFMWKKEHSDGQPNTTKAQERVAEDTFSPTSTKKIGEKERKRLEAEARNQAYQAIKAANGNLSQLPLAEFPQSILQKLFEETEAKIHDQESIKSDIETQLSTPEVYQNPEKLHQKSKTLAAVEQEITQLYQNWELLSEHLIH